jgi:hypothetical protein
VTDPSATQDPWSLLATGDRFKIVSYSGRKYDAVFIGPGPQEAGLYVRLQDRKLARFSPSRLIWTSLEKDGGGAAILLPGDEVLVQLKDGPETAGKLKDIEPAKLTLTTAKGIVLVVAKENAVEGSVRLLFPSSDLRAGDEFIVRSSSGRDYRGRATHVEREKVTAVLPAGGDPVTIRVEHLDLKSLYVLIPVQPFTG